MKFYSFAVSLMLALFVMRPVHAQTVIVNQATIGGYAEERSTSSFLNMNGTILIAGHSYSEISGDKAADFGGMDAWVLLLNADYSINWQLILGGDEHEYFPQVIGTSDGGYLIVCESNSPISGNKTVAPIGEQDFWVLKLDSDGVIEWQNVYGGSGDEGLPVCVENADGNFIIAGYSDSPISGTVTENTLGGDVWVLKIDANGNVIWDKNLGGTDAENAEDIIIDPNGDILITGRTKSGISGNKTSVGYGGNDYWLIKIDDDGNIIFDKTYGGSSSDSRSRIACNNSSYYISGESGSGISGVKTETNIGNEYDHDLWILKTDFSGNVIWDKTIGGTDFEWAQGGPVITSDDHVMIAASSISPISGHKTQNNWQNDFWLVELDTNGNVLWDKTIGGYYSESITSIHQKGSNNFVLFGESDSPISLHKDDSCRGAKDYWVIEFSSLVGVEEKASDLLKIFPNPTSESVTFSQPVSQLEIVNLQGQLVYSDYGTVIETADVAKLVPGIYIVKFTHDNNHYQQRLVVN